MPRYDLICIKGHKFEDDIRLSDFDKPITTPCPECGINEVKRDISAHAGYHMDLNNTASTGRKGSGSFKKRK